MTRAFNLGQAPKDGVLVFPDTPPVPLAGNYLGVTSIDAQSRILLGWVNIGTQFLPIAGGTLTGPLILARDPTATLEAVTKRYADTTFLARAGGTMTGALTLASDPTQPLHSVTKQYSDSKLALTGGTLSGNLFLNADPTNPNQAATKAYVDNRTSTLYLPLTGGTFTAPGTLAGVARLTFTSSDSLGPPTGIYPDLLWSLIDSTNGNIAVMLDTSGVLSVAALSAVLTADPTLPLGAATKQYIDNLRSNSLPLQGGTASIGVSLLLARADHTHPADATTWAPLNAPVFTTSITLGGETWLATAVEPELVWSLRDSPGGNIVVYLDYAGVLNVAALAVPTITGLLSLSAASATLTQATIAGELISDQTMPDLIGTVQGTNGNIVSGYDVVTGEFNAVSVNAGALKVSGQPLALTAPTAPTDALDVRAAAYGAKGDGVRNHGYVTTSGSLLTITNFSGTLSLTVINATTAQLDIVGTTWSGWAFQPHHEGKLLYLTAGAYTLIARIKAHGYRDGQSVLLDTTGQTVTAQTNVAGAVTCPAIDVSQSVTGKVLIVEGMGRGQWWKQTPTVSRQVDTVTPYGVQTWFTKTITSFTAPNQITITGTFPFNWTNQATTVLWGTDDGVAALNAGWDVWPLKKRVWFSGDGLYLLAPVVEDNAARPNYATKPSVDPGPLLNGCIWAGDNAQAYALSTGGQRMPHRVSPAGAPRYNDTRKMVHGRLSFPRCAQIPASQPINVLFDGDSLSAFNPQGQLAAVMGASRFLAEFIAQNPGKRINFFNIGVGGATWASLASQHALYNDTSTPLQYWTIPRPVAGTVQKTAFWANVNQTGVGPPIVPDVVVLFCCAGNDKLSCDGSSMHAMVNQIRATIHSDGYGPTDIVMQTDHHALMLVANGSGVSAGSTPPGAAAATLAEYYNMGFNRTTALNMGFPFIDYMPLQNRQAFGFDPTRRAMRQVPQVTLSLTPAVPVSLGEECLDFAAHINLAGSSDASAWQTAQQIDFQISPHPGNRLFLRYGPNGNIWAASSTYGLFVDTVVTCDPASHVITLGAAPSFTANVTFRYGWPQVDCADSSIIFDASMNGKCIIANIGNYDGVAFGRPLQRNYIRMVMDFNDAMVHQVPADAADVVIAAQPVLIGPNQFIPQDTNAQPDVSIIFPDGTIWQTQVAYNGYVSATQATLVDAPPQALSGQTVSLFLGRLGLKWFDTGVKPTSASAIGYVTISVIRGEFQIGYMRDPAAKVQPILAQKTIERFGGAFNPVIYAATSPQITLVNRWVDDDTPIAASTPAWYQRGIITTNSDYHQGGTGGHYGSMTQTAVLDTLYSHQNLSVN